jgi:hypothetical protein
MAKPRPILDSDQRFDRGREQRSIVPKYDWTYILGIAATLLLTGAGIGVLWFGF